jgi:hypothetical protein
VLTIATDMKERQENLPETYLRAEMVNGSCSWLFEVSDSFFVCLIRDTSFPRNPLHICVRGVMCGSVASH